MPPLRVFRFQTYSWHCDFRFFSDHVEMVWDKWGKGFETRMKTMLREKLQPNLAEVTAFAYGARRPLWRGVALLTAAILIGFLCPGEWRFWALVPVVFSIPQLMIGISRIRTKKWVQVQTKEGRAAFGLEVTAWTPEQIADFKEFFQAWLRNEPNQPAPAQRP